jgi:hypothetical protein
MIVGSGNLPKPINVPILTNTMAVGINTPTIAKQLIKHTAYVKI